MKTQIFGILNVTPDSFSDGGVLVDVIGNVRLQRALEQVSKMVLDGADWIDLGGESTRPGSKPVPAETELARIVNVVQGIAEQKIPVSIDTQKPSVARAALDVGASMINDVSGLRDPEMVRLVVERQCQVCIMHMQGSPENMQSSPAYKDVVGEVRDTLVRKADELVAKGLPSELIWIDPGIGFGKTFAHNMALLKHIDAFIETKLRVFVGVSRKSMLGHFAREQPGQPNFDDRTWVGTSVHTYLLQKGVHAIRTHDTRPVSLARSWVSALMNTP